MNQQERAEAVQTEGPPSVEHVTHRNRLYRVLSRISRAMVHAHEPQALYEDICRIAVVEGAFAMAWVGLVDPEKQRVCPVAWSGAEDGYLDNIHVSLNPHVGEGQGPTGTAAREGHFHVINSVANDPQMRPWREQALKRGYLSCAGFPFRSRGQVMGALTVYSHVPGFFSSEEVELLEDTMRELSFALDKMEAEAAREAARKEVMRLNAELEERVRDRTTQFEAANRDLEAFAYTVSHDLRSPLTVVEGFSRILREDFAEQLGEEGTHYLDSIVSSVTRMQDIISGLLRLSRLGLSALQPAEVDLSAMSEEVMMELMSAAPQREVTLRIQPGVTAWGDPTLLRIVLENLLQNAFKFTSARPTALIELLAKDDPEGTVYRIQDNGAGLDMCHADRVFMPFQRLHSNDDYPGCGIGLATVRRIVELHGGNVSIDGAPDQGCCVTFSLALQR